MGVGLDQYRLSIGLFNRVKFTTSLAGIGFRMLANIAMVLLFCMLSLLLLLSGDIHPNPGPERPTLHEPKLCHINIRSLSDVKFLALQTSVMKVFDIIALSETWLPDDTENENDDETDLPDPEAEKFRVDGFHDIIKLSRPDRGGGGVAVYIRETINYKRLYDLEDASVEALWLEIKLRPKSFILGVCYRPPNSGVIFWENFQEVVDRVKLLDVKSILIVGDLNADPNAAHGPHLQHFTQVNVMSALIDKPTRVTANTATILDQVLTNDVSLVKSTWLEPPVSTNDHATVCVSLNTQVCTRGNFKRNVWLFDRGDYAGFREALLEAPFDECFQSDDIDNICRDWTKLFLQTARRFVPNYLVTVRPRDKPWYSNVLRRLKRKVTRAYNLAKRTSNAMLWQRYKILQREYSSSIADAKAMHDRRVEESLTDQRDVGPRKWWKIVKDILLLGSKPNIPSIEVNNDIVTSSRDKAEAFNAFFLSHSSIDETGARLPNDAHQIATTLDKVTVSEQEVIDLLKGLDARKATGPDGISPRLLKEAAPAIAPSLARLFNLSLSTGKVPQGWKQANVIPIFKKGARTDRDNYRPISLLSCVGKVLEKVVFKQLFNYFRENFLISIYQSGFTPGDSTVNQLVSVYHQFCEAIDKKKDIRIVFCDISKAFDRVWHKGLLFKLKYHMGIDGILLEWFKNYLDDRYQRVVIEGEESTWGKIKAGVPQGSILGPLLFLVYINDITSVVNCNIRLFADDTILYINVDDHDESARDMNVNTSAVSEWAKTWLVKFSLTKTKSMVMTRKPDGDVPPITFDQALLSEVDNYKHLGVYLNRSLTWTDHVQRVTVRAGKKLDILKRMKYRLDSGTLKTMYVTFIRPSLEYASPVWCNLDQQMVDKLERLNLDAARIITGAIRGTRHELLYRESGLETLTARRQRTRLVLIHKMINGTAPTYMCNLLPERVGVRQQYSLRNANNISMPYCRTELLKNSFLPRTIQDWNNLPDELKSIQDEKLFKKRLTDPVDQALICHRERKLDVILARLRMECSSLNYHLKRLYVIDDARCPCGHARETVNHYFFDCPLHVHPREALMRNLAQLPINIMHTSRLLLYGEKALPARTNDRIADALCNFIMATNRFNL